MSYDHDKAQAKYTQFKSRLTRALNTKDHARILAECKAFFDYYADSAEPMPDYWHRWQRAQFDATFALQRERTW